jgi:hypothetical protein
MKNAKGSGSSYVIGKAVNTEDEDWDSKPAHRFSLRRQENAALVLAAGHVVRRRVHSGDLPAFEVASKKGFAVRVQVGAGSQLHVVLMNRVVD